MDKQWKAMMREPQRYEYCEHCRRSVMMQARRLMLEYYDADLYKRAYEEHLKLCTRPILITRDAKENTNVPLQG